MKVILVDAINTFIVNGKTNQNMFALLESYPNKKIILTNANTEEQKQLGLDKAPYELFTLSHNPKKTDPLYYKEFLRQYNLSADTVVYFEHNPEAVASAQTVGIKTYYYEKDKEDLTALKEFLDKNLS